MADHSTIDQRFKSKVTEILPNTERVKARIAKQKQAEKLRQQELEKMKMKRELEEKQRMQMQIQQQAKAEEMKRRQEEDERRKHEESALISTLQGKFGSMISNLKNNDTNLDYTISGLQLKDAQVRILVKAVEQNKTLKGLSMPRKGINDLEGREIARSLIVNQTLERLELEGNKLGPETCKAVASLLLENKQVRSIDLEGNHLLINSNGHTTTEGIKEIAHALEGNYTLLCLNLANTGLEKECSEYLMRMLEKNQTLISLDIDSNPKMDLHHVRAIQQSLKRNKKAYDDERYQEFLERKQMWREQNISQILTQNLEAKKVLQENINTRIEAKRQALDDDWTKKIDQEEILRQKQIIKLEKEAQLKKKGKKGRKKKKK